MIPLSDKIPVHPQIQSRRKFLKELGIYILGSSLLPPKLYSVGQVDIKANLANQGHMVDVHFFPGKELEYFVKLGELADSFGKMKRDAALAEQGVALIREGKPENLAIIVNELRPRLLAAEVAWQAFKDDQDVWDKLIITPENFSGHIGELETALANLSHDLRTCLPFGHFVQDAYREAKGIALEKEPKYRTYFGPDALLYKFVAKILPLVDEQLDQRGVIDSSVFSQGPQAMAANKYQKLRRINTFGQLYFKAEAIRIALNKIDFLRSVYYFGDYEHSYRGDHPREIYRRRVGQALIAHANIEEIHRRQRRYAESTGDVFVPDDILWYDEGPAWIKKAKLEHFRALMTDFAGQLPKHEISVLEKKADAYLQSVRK